MGYYASLNLIHSYIPVDVINEVVFYSQTSMMSLSLDNRYCASKQIYILWLMHPLKKWTNLTGQLIFVVEGWPL